MFVYGKSKTVFFPSDTLIYRISRDGSKNFNKRTCEHMILPWSAQDEGTSNEKCTPAGNPLPLLFMENSINNFHFVFRNPSLRLNLIF